MTALMTNLGEIVIEASSIFVPPERLTVAEASERYVYLNDAPAYVGPWKADKTPYMVEPMNTIASRDHTAVVFCGSAQSGKSQALILNAMAYFAICNPMDVILYHMSKPAARDFSIRRVDRGHRNSAAWGAQLPKRGNADNTFDKQYKTGMILSISWPSINEMSSKPVPVVMFTDYDRMPKDIDGEGSPFMLGQKRTTTFRNLGMTVAESSPSHDVIEQEGDEGLTEREEVGPHEAPPTTGILGLYNQGDRRRWYWPCPECGEYFEGSFSDLRWPTKDEHGKNLSLPEMAARVRMICPHNDCRIKPENRDAMNLKGRWLAEGERIDRDGNVTGEARYSRTASFWLKGPAAAYTTWQELALKHLEAERQYELTGSEDDLRATTNTDQAEPYRPKKSESARAAIDLQARASDLPVREVPTDVRALLATIDTQGNRWEVQVHGVRPGRPYDLVVVDRFKIEKSRRTDEDGDPLWVKPASYPEDWDLIEEMVLDKTYPLADGSGHMEIAFTICDSGGSKSRSHDKKVDEIDNDMSVTSNAYDFYRRLKREGKHERFLLLKGDPNLNAPRAHISYPDSKRSGRQAGAMGEIPVLFLNVNSLKDSLNAMLDRDNAGGGMIDFPDWLPSWWFKELTSEVRGRRGWAKLGSRRNEAWDLLTYCIGLCVYRRVEKVDWEEPPPWLQDWDHNPYVLTQGREVRVDKTTSSLHRLAELGAELA